MKVAPDPVISEVVRQRLELLLAEVRPRHALPEADPGAGDVDEVAAPRVRSGPGVVEPDLPGGRSPRGPAGRSGPPAGEVAAELGRRALEFSREHLAAVVLVLLVGCGWTAYSLLQARSTAVAVAVAAPATVVASPSPTASAPASVVVHVIGAVHSPGLVELPDGSRVADAITAAGGLAGSADPGELNLAATLADGSQLVIGTRAKPRGEVRGADGSGSGTAGGASGKVSLNSATSDQLDTLPGVGPVTAQKIVAWRQQHGRFTTVTELQEVDGIGPKTYADIAPHVRL